MAVGAFILAFGCSVAVTDPATGAFVTGFGIMTAAWFGPFPVEFR